MLNILLTLLTRNGPPGSYVRRLKHLKATIAASPLLFLLFSPSYAQSSYQMEYIIPQKVVIGQTAQDNGQAKIMIASNSPFFITAEGVIGEICVNIALSGTMQGKKFGANAQLPGHQKTCKMLKSTDEQVIYTADRRTALLPGTPLSQSIVAHISYAHNATPVFDIPTLNERMQSTG